MTRMPLTTSAIVLVRLSVQPTISRRNTPRRLPMVPVTGTSSSMTPRPTKHAHSTSRYNRNMMATTMSGEPQIMCTCSITSCNRADRHEPPREARLHCATPQQA